MTRAFYGSEKKKDLLHCQNHCHKKSCQKTSKRSLIEKTIFLMPSTMASVYNPHHFMSLLTSRRTPDSTDTNYRYAAYASRARTILLSAHRYVAYTSDIGESFRLIAHPWLVRGAYGISWAYLIGDVSHEGYKAYCRNQKLLHPSPDFVKKSTGTTSTVTPDTVSTMTKNVHIPAIEDYRAVMIQRAIFQSIASMGLPAFTIHSIVRYSCRALKNVKNTKLKTWGPIGVSRSL